MGCSPWVSKSWTRLSDFTFTFHFHALQKEMATHSSAVGFQGCCVKGQSHYDSSPFVPRYKRGMGTPPVSPTITSPQRDPVIPTLGLSVAS